MELPYTVCGNRIRYPLSVFSLCSICSSTMETRRDPLSSKVHSSECVKYIQSAFDHNRLHYCGRVSMSSSTRVWSDFSREVGGIQCAITSSEWLLVSQTQNKRFHLGPQETEWWFFWFLTPVLPFQPRFQIVLFPLSRVVTSPSDFLPTVRFQLMIPKIFVWSSDSIK